jgi:hypothetical protein
MLLTLCIVAALSAAAWAKEESEGKIKTFVFEEQKISGKIRRPQLVLIKADQRPEFEPMAIRIFGKNKNVVDFLDKSVVEDSPYKGPFQVEGQSIANEIP